MTKSMVLGPCRGILYSNKNGYTTVHPTMKMTLTIKLRENSQAQKKVHKVHLHRVQIEAKLACGVRSQNIESSVQEHRESLGSFWGAVKIVLLDQGAAHKCSLKNFVRCYDRCISIFIPIYMEVGKISILICGLRANLPFL